MGTKDYIKEMFIYRDGLRQHAEESNKHLGEWLMHHEDNLHFQNINCVAVDFLTPEVALQVIRFNEIFFPF